MTNRELDAKALNYKIARDVMEWEQIMDFEHKSKTYIAFKDADGYPRFIDSKTSIGKLWSPATNIADAWMVVEKMIELEIEGDFHLEHLDGAGWRVGICGRDEWFPYAETAPEAICLAALKAVEDKTAKRRANMLSVELWELWIFFRKLPSM
jgi:hypothetical protein